MWNPEPAQQGEPSSLSLLLLPTQLRMVTMGMTALPSTDHAPGALAKP